MKNGYLLFSSIAFVFDFLLQPAEKKPPSTSCLHISFVKTKFTDVAGNAWYASAVNYVVDKGLMNGTGEGKFSPPRPTRPTV